MLKSIYAEAPLVGHRHRSSRRHHNGDAHLLCEQVVQPRQCPVPPPVGVIGPAKDPTGVPPLELPQSAVDNFIFHPIVEEVEEYTHDSIDGSGAKSGPLLRALLSLVSFETDPDFYFLLLSPMLQCFNSENVEAHERHNCSSVSIDTGDVFSALERNRLPPAGEGVQHLTRQA
ncbi:conserved hypothetical protein [Neospora caninum Liverpool]|uniref:Uncharacterized protein n=1 Tax=Neospora caninum (strain Liverpool) TaxID=572307 RepID=F0VEW8_NEOCL|nr:conserved hypothetical protein [Neospora caninum Liverpool]CBZ52262.1 conserved hypothetical protein [Neospora caninum Liverpool]CEL66230.1 TPA: hypothetical protein BN1204_020490 [Neospora caninum Liverpool]|eukprot:XP_003882294.1 conserved hypothetical protein [Neospora caninum Liverpool]